MKLVYYKQNLSFDFSVGKLNSLVLESPILFEHFLVDLYNMLGRQGEEFDLFEEGNKLNLLKRCELISTPFDLHFEKREIQKKLFDELEKSAEDIGLTGLFAETHGRMVALLDELSISSMYELSFNDELCMTDMFKAYDMQIKKPEGSFCEKLIEYMICLQILTGKDFFVIANCDGFLLEGDYEHLEKCVKYYNLCLLFVRNQQLALNFPQQEYIIDVDLCEIH